MSTTSQAMGPWHGIWNTTNTVIRVIAAWREETHHYNWLHKVILTCMTMTRNWDIMYEAMISEGSTPVIHDRSSRPCAEFN